METIVGTLSKAGSIHKVEGGQPKQHCTNWSTAAGRRLCSSCLGFPRYRSVKQTPARLVTTTASPWHDLRFASENLETLTDLRSVL